LVLLAGLALGFLPIFTMVRRFGATTAVLPARLMPVVAGALGIWLLGEVITTTLGLGAW